MESFPVTGEALITIVFQENGHNEILQAENNKCFLQKNHIMVFPSKKDTMFRNL